MSSADTQSMPLEESLRELTLTSHVGFDSLPDQLVNKSVQQGFSFNILCIGETGIGKSVLMDTLFNTHFESTPSSHNLPGVSVKTNTYDLLETNVRLKLTIVNSVAFGDQIDKSESYQPIIEYIDSQFDAYLQEELKIKRSLHSYHDTRIHSCLYFITPTGHSLKSLDLVTMKALDSKVNIIPIIAKADTITKAELHKFKLKIIGELVTNSVKIYQFPTDDETVADINNSMNKFLPFAVVGSMDEVKVGNKFVKARQYPWGTVQVENESHCDFVRLREMLIRQNMQDLVENTHTRHYELYRRSRLQDMGFNDNDNMSMRDAYEIKRKEHLEDLKILEDERKKMFICRVQDKEAELKKAENQMKQKIEHYNRDEDNELKRMKAKQKELDDEIHNYRQKKNSTSNLQKKKK